MSQSLLHTISLHLRNLVFPQTTACPLCGKRPANGRFCRNCQNELFLSKKQDFCQRCGRIIDSRTSPFCSECLGAEFPFQFARGAGEYKGIFRAVLYDFKYVGRQSLAEPMGRLMAETMVADRRFAGTELLVPLPLAPAKLAQRKFNQSDLLAREIGRSLGLPIVEEALQRTKDTRIQAKLTRAQRRVNLKGAFCRGTSQAVAILKGRKIVLVDDVFTTGTTMTEAARVLLGAGTAEIAAITWATGNAVGKRVYRCLEGEG